MKPLWVLINRARNAWKQPMAIECEKCGAMCAEEKAWAKHMAWHQNLYAEVMKQKCLAEQGQGPAKEAARA